MQLGLRSGTGGLRLRRLLRLPGSGRQGRRPAPGTLTPSRTLITPMSPAAGRRPAPLLRFAHADRSPDGDFSAGAVPNADLGRHMVPPAGGSWAEVEELALSYDGYGYWSDVAELGNRSLQRWTRDRTLPPSLDELRGCLFYEQRRWHHFGEEPHGRGAEYVRALVEAIRAAVTPTPVTPVQATPARVTPSQPAPPVRPSPPAVLCFSDDDDGYRAWTTAHDGGFVVNAPKAPSAKGLRLHRAGCSSVAAPVGSSRSPTARVRKVCASDVAALLDWCATALSAEPEPCLRCRP